MNRGRAETPWASFLPDYLLRELENQPRKSPVGMERRFGAAALFADVSGFTPMSEALGQSGRRGAEELTSILNSYFEPTIDLITRYGGTVAKFGGDAMTVVFPSTPRNRGVVARRALQCALEMQAGMRRYEAITTSAGTFCLTVKEGLAHGEVLSTVVGDPAIQLEHVVAGSVLDLCAEAEHCANPGEVVAHETVLTLAGGAETHEVAGDFSRVSALIRPVRRAPARARERAGPGASVARFLHPSLTARLEAGQSGMINEHRRVTVLFGRFDDLDYDHDPRAGQQLQRYIADVIRTIERFGGFLRQVDMGDKGSKYIALFGAPIAHEHNEERALRCALELQAIDGFATAIGINSGFAFCGLVGSAVRREYAVMGDAVNVAARLMQGAEPGRTLVSETTQRCAPEGFTWRALQQLQLKGKSEPIQVFEHEAGGEPRSIDLHEPEYRLPIVGRERELDAARATLTRALEGRGQIIGIAGEAGIGKSRLAAEIVRHAITEGMSVYAGACQSYGTSASYLVWRDVWRHFFDVDPSHSAAELLDQLEALLQSIGSDLAARAPLLGAVLNVPLPDNALTRSLDPERRTESLKELLLQCLRHRAGEAPILILLEDCQWIDDLSQELLELIGRNIADLPVLLLVPYRTPDTDHGPISWAMRRPNCAEARLEELSPGEVEELIRQKLGQLYTADAEPSATFIERIIGRAQGNPFYAEEMVSFLRDRGIGLDDDAGLAELELPDTLQSLIMSRIDMLADSEKTTLKVASVLGRTFKASWLWASYPQAGTPEEVKRSLDVLSQLDLTLLDKPEPELEYIFKHVTTQEVAYESLAFGTRETLHESVGEFIERAYPDELDQRVDVLAHHYGHSRNTGKKRVYFRRAGDVAARDYANEAAVRYYRLLLPLLSDPEKGDVMLRMGEVLELVGEWDRAEELFRNALRVAEEGGSELDVARSRAALGVLFSFTHSYDEAIRWLEEARERLAAIGAHNEVARVLDRLSFTYYQQSKYAEARSYAEEHLRLSAELGDEAGRAAAAENLGQIYFHQGEHARAAEYLEQALQFAAQSGQKRVLIHAGNDLAGVHASQGDYATAVRYLDEAFAVAAEIGYQQLAGMMLANAGELCRLQGDLEGAVARCSEALEIAGRLGDRRGLLDAVGRIGLICAEDGRDSHAERLFDRAIQLSRTLNDRWVLCEALFDQAKLHAGRGESTDAASLCREAVSVAADVGNREIELPARVLLARLEVEDGNLSRGQGATVLEGLLTDCLDEVEQAAVHYGLWDLDEHRTTSQQAAARLYKKLYDSTPNVEYRDRYERLTGKRLPDPPFLPPVADSVSNSAIEIDALAARAETLSARLE